MSQGRDVAVGTRSETCRGTVGPLLLVQLDELSFLDVRA